MGKHLHKANMRIFAQNVDHDPHLAQSFIVFVSTGSRDPRRVQMVLLEIKLLFVVHFTPVLLRPLQAVGPLSLQQTHLFLTLSGAHQLAISHPASPFQYNHVYVELLDVDAKFDQHRDRRDGLVDWSWHGRHVHGRHGGR
jgi:hypothetical protein